MKEETRPVSVMKVVDGQKKQVKVADVNVTVYETVAELTANETEEHICNMFNKANIIRIQANERAKHKEGRMSKERQREAAYNLLTNEELIQFRGNMAALKDFLMSEEMQARVQAEQESSEVA